MKLVKTLIIAAAVALPLIGAAQNNVAEEVAWIVGDQPIWKSDIEEAYQAMLSSRSQIQGDPYCFVPEQLAIEKLYLHQADIDTVEVNDAQVMAEVDAQINAFMTQLGSREKMEEYFHKSQAEIRRTLLETVRNRNRVQQVQRELTKDVSATPKEVRKYYETLTDEDMPYIPLSVEVQLLQVNPIIQRQEVEDVKARLREMADKVNAGESDFSTLAILYSEDHASAMQGGEIGFMGRGQLDANYAATAFNLSDPKKASKVVESEYGYHIIQLIEKRGDRVNSRHILLTPKVSDHDLNEALVRLDSVRMDIVDKGLFNFEAAIGYISQDKDTRSNRGMMVNDQTGSTQFQMSELPQEIAMVVDTMAVGQISKPFVMKDLKHNRDVVCLVKLASRTEGHRANLSDDYQRIRQMYEAQLMQKTLDDWLEKKINETYVRIEDGWRDCNFAHKGWIKESASDKR